jgi:hypothetical protein
MRKDRNLENVRKFIYIFLKSHGNVLVDLSIRTVNSHIPGNMKFIQKENPGHRWGLSLRQSKYLTNQERSLHIPFSWSKHGDGTRQQGNKLEI